MDILGFLTGGGNVDIRLVGAIIVLLLGVRGLDRKQKVLGKGAYILMVVAAGMIAGALKVGLSVSGLLPWLLAWAESGIMHAAVASIVYQLGKVVIPSEDQYWLRRGKKPGKPK